MIMITIMIIIIIHFIHLLFDAKLRSRGAVLSRLDIPSSIPDSALFSFHQPIGSGGFGSR